AARCGCVHLRRTSCLCQRSSVCGVTIRPRQLRRGRIRLDAVRKARSAGRRRGRCCCRLSTASSVAQNQHSDALDELAAPASTEQPQNGGDREVNKRKDQPPMLPEVATARSRTET